MMVRRGDPNEDPAILAGLVAAEMRKGNISKEEGELTINMLASLAKVTDYEDDE